MREPENTSRWSLAVVLRRGESGPQLAVEPVTDADLVEHRAEAWFAGSLREGERGLSMSQVPMRVVPELMTSGRCSGFHIETFHASGRPIRHPFTTRSLKEVATRVARRLIASGTLTAEEICYFELIAQPSLELPESVNVPQPSDADPGQPALGSLPETDESLHQTAQQPPLLTAQPEEQSNVGITFTSREAPLRFLSVPLRSLLPRAVRVGPAIESLSPVFYTKEAFDLAERFARRGAGQHPARETGAVLIGPLCACPESGEVFAVIAHVVEVAEAEEMEFSLSYTGPSWSRIQAVLQALRSGETTRSWRLLGQSHGHNFPPGNGEEPCESCPRLAACTRTSVFVSEADQMWSRAVFSRQPWHLCHIFGLNARGEHVHGLFGQRDGRLQDRPLYLIPEFDPHEWKEG
jgi:hypothetical protein